MKIEIDVLVKGGLPLIAEGVVHSSGEIDDVTLYWPRKPFRQVSDAVVDSISKADWDYIHDTLWQEYNAMRTDFCGLPYGGV